MHLRADAAHLGHGPGGRPAGHRAPAGHGRGLPGVRAQPLPLAHRAGQRRTPAEGEAPAQGAPQGTGRRGAGGRRTRPRRGRPPLGALRRHAAAGRHRPRHRLRAAGAADGRAVRRGGRPDPRRPGGPGPPAVEAVLDDRAVRDARHRRGGLPRPAGPGALLLAHRRPGRRPDRPGRRARPAVHPLRAALRRTPLVRLRRDPERQAGRRRRRCEPMSGEQRPATVRDAALDVLREYGLTTVFANPGSTEVAFLTDLPGDIDFVLALHEGSVVGMATGWALARRRPALVQLHTTAGLGNAVGALATARANRAPLVVLVGQQDRRHLALEPFLTGRLRGLAGDYPVWTEEPAVPQAVPGAPAAADPAAVEGLARLLDEATAPALVVGAGADGEEEWAALTALAERLGTPVYQESFGARAGFPQDHPLFAGFLPADRPRLREAL